MQPPGHAGAEQAKSINCSEKNGIQGPVGGNLNALEPLECDTLTQSLG